MPSVSMEQHRLMAMCSTEKGRSKAKNKCPPRDVAREYMIADKKKSYKRKV